jgi:hypothetical protein
MSAPKTRRNKPSCLQVGSLYTPVTKSLVEGDKRPWTLVSIGPRHQSQARPWEEWNDVTLRCGAETHQTISTDLGRYYGQR